MAGTFRNIMRQEEQPREEGRGVYTTGLIAGGVGIGAYYLGRPIMRGASNAIWLAGKAVEIGSAFRGAVTAHAAKRAGRPPPPSAGFGFGRGMRKKPTVSGALWGLGKFGTEATWHLGKFGVKTGVKAGRFAAKVGAGAYRATLATAGARWRTGGILGLGIAMWGIGQAAFGQTYMPPPTAPLAFGGNEAGPMTFSTPPGGGGTYGGMLGSSGDLAFALSNLRRG